MENITNYGYQARVSTATNTQTQPNNAAQRRLSDTEIRFDANKDGKLDDKELGLLNKLRYGKLNNIGKSGKSCLELSGSVSDIETISETNGVLSIKFNNGNVLKLSEGTDGKYQQSIETANDGASLYLSGNTFDTRPNIEFYDNDNLDTKFSTFSANKVRIVSNEQGKTNNNYIVNFSNSLTYENKGTSSGKDTIVNDGTKRLNISTAKNKIVDLNSNIRLSDMDSATLCASGNSQINAKYNPTPYPSDIPFWDFWGHTESKNEEKLKTQGNVNLKRI